MKSKIYSIMIAVIFFISGAAITLAYAKKQVATGYILEHENDIAVNQLGPHDGGGTSTAYSYFNAAKDCKLAFKKRVLHAGSSIGYHLQNANEIYYIVSGTGEMKMNGKIFPVKAGDGILTLPGSSHGLTPTGNEDLVVIISYEK